MLFLYLEAVEGVFFYFFYTRTTTSKLHPDKAERCFHSDELVVLDFKEVKQEKREREKNV